MCASPVLIVLMFRTLVPERLIHIVHRDSRGICLEMD